MKVLKLLLLSVILFFSTFGVAQNKCVGNGQVHLIKATSGVYCLDDNNKMVWLVAYNMQTKSLVIQNIDQEYWGKPLKENMVYSDESNIIEDNKSYSLSYVLQTGQIKDNWLPVYIVGTY